MRTSNVITSAAGLIAGLAIGLGGSAGASTAAHHAAKCTINSVASPYTRHVIPAGTSLADWSEDNGTTPADVLSATAQCGPGWQQLSVHRYVNAGHWCRPFAANAVVWALVYKP